MVRAVALLILVVGALFAIPVAIILLTVVILVELVHQVWMRFGLRGVVYTRRLGRDRMTWGEEIPTTIEVWNRKRLPVAWLRAEDQTARGILVREGRVAPDPHGQKVLRNAWTLAPFERVTRHFHLSAERRGVYELGPVRLSVGDLFASEAATEDRAQIETFVVWPRRVDTTPLLRRDRWGGLDRALAGLSEDPSRFAGIREYTPGDSLRRVHPRASARLGRPVVKRFEPSRDREVLIVLDVERGDISPWETQSDVDAVESLFVVAASLVRSLGLERVAFGLVAAGYQGGGNKPAWLPVSEAPGQAVRAFDLLARLSANPFAPFERTLGLVARTVRPGCTVVVLTARDPSPFFVHLRRLEHAGSDVVLVACGPDSASDAARARAAGLAARTAQLDDQWRTAEHLAMSR
jgi:uncharacterized protein (DUF58 family)